MIDVSLAFVGGLLGSAHCVGMCGPLAAMIGSNAVALRRNLHRQVVYSAGRIFTYAFGGAAVGFASQWAVHQSRWLVLTQAVLALAAGTLMALIGLATLGVLPRRAIAFVGQAPCGAAAALKTILTAQGWLSVFLAGVGTGFIPCGLVYAFLLKASATGHLWNGAATMAAFGLGTAPLMVVAGSGAGILSATSRARVYRMAAWCVVLAGAITVGRGVNQLRSPESGPAPCPLCTAAHLEP